MKNTETGKKISLSKQDLNSLQNVIHGNFTSLLPIMLLI